MSPRRRVLRDPSLTALSHTTTNRLGALIPLYRIMHGLTVADCAADIGIPASALTRLEQHDTTMSADGFLKLATWLLGRNPSPQHDATVDR